MYQGRNHTCETLIAMTNTAYHDHGDLPKKFSCQMDNAQANKNWAVLGLLGAYV